mmetsp:Transcript_6384/g.26028  ORF Transcript_6384/g.26028 Transcript_6384/m.26028 type:complete len:371 (+) Transcript_6384:3-1115(+)
MPQASPSPRGLRPDTGRPVDGLCLPKSCGARRSAVCKTGQAGPRSAGHDWARGSSHPEVLAEIDLAHIGIGDDLVGRAFGEHGALADDVGAVADAQGLADVVVRDQHADAARLQEADDALDLQHRDRVDARERLVQQDEARLRGQGPGDLDPAAFTAGQRRRRAVAQALDGQVVQQATQQFIDARLAQGPAALVHLQLQHRADVLLDRQLAEDRGLLRQIAQAQPCAGVDGQALHLGAVDADHAGVRAHQADDHVEAGRLAGAIGAQQADDLAAVHAHMDVLDHLAHAIGLGQALGFEPAAAVVDRAHEGLRGGVIVVEGCSGSADGVAPPGADAAASAGSRGISTMRTRPLGLGEALPPSSANTSVRLS